MQNANTTRHRRDTAIILFTVSKCHRCPLDAAGQIAIAPDGSVPDGIESQSTLVFENIKNILASGDMGLENLVRLNVYIVNPNDMAGFRTVRDKYVGDIKCGSTMIVIAGLAKPEFLIEIEAMAAKSDG